MSKLKFFIKKILFKKPFGKKIWQISKAILLLRQRSFRQLFLEVKRDDICLDIGANIGYASLVMWLKGVKKIYALEPNKEAFEVLKKNLSGIKNIFYLNIAISNKTEKQKLYLHKSIKEISNPKKIVEVSEASSLLSNKTNLGECFYEVEAMSLNDLVAEIKGSPNVIKCDIEGAEYIIYHQLINFAKSKGIRKMFVECHAKKYKQYIEPHNNFMELIFSNNLEKIIDTTWH